MRHVHNVHARTIYGRWRLRSAYSHWNARAPPTRNTPRSIKSTTLTLFFLHAKTEAYTRRRRHGITCGDYQIEGEDKEAAAGGTTPRVHTEEDKRNRTMAAAPRTTDSLPLGET